MVKKSEEIIVNKDQIDLIPLLNLIRRNKILISGISFSFCIIFSIFGFSKKDVWEGNFEIVLDDASKSNDLLSSIGGPLGNSIINPLLGKKNTSLKTEVGILESPSVLMPVFKFLNEERLKNKFSEYSYSKWKKNLVVELKDKTSILNISYIDEDKNLIIPVLEKVSNTYQTYSGNFKKRELELAEKYLIEQINIYQKKSANSLKAAQEYAIEEDLVFYDLGEEIQINTENNTMDLVGNASLQAPNLLLPNIGIENSRVQAANRIRTINLQLKKIQELNNSEELQYIGSTIPALESEGLPKALRNIEAQLLAARSKYAEKDNVIINLIRQRKFAIELLKNRTIKYLEFQKLNAEAAMKAAMRPKGVILKYKKLIREAARDENTLVALEDQLRGLKLEGAKLSDPWKLITEPTLKLSPVGPKKLNYSFAGIILGFIIALFYSKFKEKESNLIFEKSDLENILNTKIIDNFNLFNKSFDNYDSKVLFKEILGINSKEKIYFTWINNLENQFIENFKNLLESFSSENNISIDRNILFTDDLSLLDSDSKVILITTLDSLTFEETYQFKTRIDIRKISIFSTLIFNKNFS